MHAKPASHYAQGPELKISPPNFASDPLRKPGQNDTLKQACVDNKIHVHLMCVITAKH